MKIGIIGAGKIGATLTRKLSATGHNVKVANSRGPETIPAELLDHGVRAVTADEIVQDVEVVVLSVPSVAIPNLVPALSGLTEDVTVVDTSNYYPRRDGEDFLPAGAVESVWVSEQIGHPVVKAWNAITATSLATKGLPAGAPGRLALPIAADRRLDKQRAMTLVEACGFDAFDAGPLAESWRQQPGTPAYCTDLTLRELPEALAQADADHAPVRRDLAASVIADWLGTGVKPDARWSLAAARVIFGGPGVYDSNA